MGRYDLPMGRWLAVCLIAIAIAGCSPKSEGAGAIKQEASEVSNPAELLREQLSSGAFQSDAAIESIANAMESARRLVALSNNPETKAASTDVAEIIEQCGKRMAEFVEEPPSIETVRDSFATFDESRLKAIESANDCIHDLNEAHGILESIVDGASIEFASEARKLDALVLSSIDDLMGAVRAFGGAIEIED